MSSSKKVIATTNAPSALGPYSQGIETSGTAVYVSGQTPLDPATGNMVSGDIDAQTRQSLLNVKAVLTAAGAEMKHVVKTTVFITDMNDFAAMNAVYSEFFTDTYPARSTVQVSRLPKDARVEIEAIAFI